MNHEIKRGGEKDCFLLRPTFYKWKATLKKNILRGEKMKMIKVTQCCCQCCGCSLETGCKVIAILGLIGGVIGVHKAIIASSFDSSAINIFQVLSNIPMLAASAMLLWGTL